MSEPVLWVVEFEHALMGWVPLEASVERSQRAAFKAMRHWRETSPQWKYRVVKYVRAGGAA
jgi:hypothetical protein